MSLDKAHAILETLLRVISPLNFYDHFNRRAEDTDIWVSGGDNGAFREYSAIQRGTGWILETGTIIDNDRYIHGDGAKNNKMFTPYEKGYSTVTFETEMHTTTATDINALFGLFYTPPIDYEEPTLYCAHFFLDTAISNTFKARSYRNAEEETDTLVALDVESHTFKIVWTRTSVKFYIDNVLKATHSVEVPDISLVLGFLVRTKATAKKSMALKYVSVEVT